MIPKLEMMFKDNKNSTQCQLSRPDTLTTVEIRRSRLLVERQYMPHLLQEKPHKKTEWLADIETFLPSVESLLQFSRAIGPAPMEWEHYNAQLERFYEQYERYLTAKRDYEHLLGRTAALELKMLNAGESIARDLLVSMRLPQGILLYSESDYPQKPVEPQPPEKPAPVYEKMLQRTLDIQKAEALMMEVSRVEPQIITDLNIRRGDGYDVSFRIKKLPQQGKLVVGKFFVVFPNLEAATSFSIDYKVFTEETHIVKAGTLGIKVLNQKKQPLA